MPIFPHPSSAKLTPARLNRIIDPPPVLPPSSCLSLCAVSKVTWRWSTRRVAEYLQSTCQVSRILSTHRLVKYLEKYSQTGKVPVLQWRNVISPAEGVPPWCADLGLSCPRPAWASIALSFLVRFPNPLGGDLGKVHFYPESWTSLLLMSIILLLCGLQIYISDIYPWWFLKVSEIYFLIEASFNLSWFGSP